MTDSVNCVAFFDPVSLDISIAIRYGRRTPASRLLRGRAVAWRFRFGLWRVAAFFAGGCVRLPSSRRRSLRLRHRRRASSSSSVRRASGSVEAPIVLGRAEDLLHVVLRLGKRDVVDELVARDARPLGHPAAHAAVAGVVAGERQVHAAELA